MQGYSWRQFVEGQRAAAEAARRVDRPLGPEESWRAALGLRRLAARALAEPDPVREREVAEARAAWARLRAGMR